MYLIFCANSDQKGEGAERPLGEHTQEKAACTDDVNAWSGAAVQLTEDYILVWTSVLLARISLVPSSVQPCLSL